MAEDSLDGRRIGSGYEQQAGGGAAEIVKPNPSDQRLRPELHPAGGAEPQLRIGVLGRVAAALPAADVLVPEDDPRASERAAKHVLDVDVLSQHRAVGRREDQVGRRMYRRR